MSGETAEPDLGLVEVINAHQYVPTALRGVSKCSCGELMHGMPHDHRAHLASVVQSYVEAAVVGALEGAAALVERDHTMPPRKDHHNYRYRAGWWDAALHIARVVREQRVRATA